MWHVFTLPGLRFGSLFGLGSPIVTVPIFGTDIRTRIGIQVRVEQCKYAIKIVICEDKEVALDKTIEVLT